MNLGEIKASLRAHGYAADSDAAQTLLVNTVLRRIYGQRRWKFLEETGTFILPAATGSYTLTDNQPTWQSVDSIRWQDTSATDLVWIDYLGPQEFREVAPTNDTGDVSYWTQRGDALLFAPVPTKDTTLSVDYILKPPDLMSDPDVPLLPSQYHDALVWGGIKAITFRQRDWGGYQVAAQEYDRRVGEMMSEENMRQRQGATHIRRSGLWSGLDNFWP